MLLTDRVGNNKKLGAALTRAAEAPMRTCLRRRHTDCSIYLTVLTQRCETTTSQVFPCPFQFCYVIFLYEEKESSSPITAE
jgi:hypothetical protein